ncbi:MAG TPA: leucine dehydrogenase [Candidatus Magasanikbacteria bacterium]|uniref:Leucine dehydrogenase n=2 Tax=Candidatus Magasanikiibacteriota TaxID=1752731 RepID=A0A0G0WMT6_9BACT|nr:MAG: Leucine dehydrogenase [Candidatus Magasanikbacteria bacterium GW2011_GWC2_41_17]KKS13402.1 MAG: Leucine dehydrogenase [Candidatus Magasanikbacteria bacterium GW2011_GWA2_41_55]HBV58036.1 leucine dehydrogenase [Candidatus Magasanikbacteria bacterium]HBX15692.1 leucine dehydrogenase [Candidatus Magasanikbacteria bacterium]
MGKFKSHWADFGPLPNAKRCVRFEIGDLMGFIIIHNTTLGPGLGGLRVKPYESEAATLADAARLGRGMVYKNAAAGLELGGAKAVINAEPDELTANHLRAYGEVVQELSGHYITAPDVGTEVSMMDIIMEATRYVVCVSREKGGLDDPSPSTARGVFLAMQEALPFAGNLRHLAQPIVLIQGFGKVGRPLAHLLQANNFKVLVAEANEVQRDQAASDGCEIVETNKVFGTHAHIFAPCATGGILNPDSITALKNHGVRLICGGANNQLQDEGRDSELLKEKKIWWAPDFVANAGGVALACTEWELRTGKITPDQVNDRTEMRLAGIGKRIRKIMAKAEDRDCTSLSAARKLAEDTVAKQGGELR